MSLLNNVTNFDKIGSKLINTICRTDCTYGSTIDTKSGSCKCITNPRIITPTCGQSPPLGSIAFSGTNQCVKIKNSN